MAKAGSNLAEGGGSRAPCSFRQRTALTQLAHHFDVVRMVAAIARIEGSDTIPSTVSGGTPAAVMKPLIASAGRCERRANAEPNIRLVPRASWVDVDRIC